MIQQIQDLVRFYSQKYHVPITDLTDSWQTSESGAASHHRAAPSLILSEHAVGIGGWKLPYGLTHGGVVGILSPAPQRGHLAERPAYRAGTFILLPQRHTNRM